MNTHALYEDVAPNQPHLSINNLSVSENALSGNYTDLGLSANADRWFEYYNGAITHGYIDLKKFNNRPLVVAFYSGGQDDSGLNLLRSLNAIQTEIKANGGNLLVVIPESVPHLEQIAWLNSFTLSFYVDSQQDLARYLGLYREQLPAPGNENAQYNLSPSVFVTDAGRKVVYRHVYNHTANVFYASDVISAVYASALSINKKEFI